MIGAWRRTSPLLSVPERMGHTFKDAAVSITITSLTDTLSFCIGIITSFPCVQIFCVYSGKRRFVCERNGYPVSSGSRASATSQPLFSLLISSDFAFSIVILELILLCFFSCSGGVHLLVAHHVLRRVYGLRRIC